MTEEDLHKIEIFHYKVLVFLDFIILNNQDESIFTCNNNGNFLFPTKYFYTMTPITLNLGMMGKVTASSKV